MAADFSTSAVTVGGCRIRLMRGGSGEPLLYLHGASGANWLPFLQTLTRNFDVIAPEHPGFGESDTPAWLDNIHDLAYFYLDLFDALQLSGVNLVGNSLGGWIAAEIAVRSTQRLASLTLAGSAGLYVPGVTQVDSYLISEEQRLNAFFYDQSKAKEMIARVLHPDMEDTALKNRQTAAKLSWQPRSHDPHLAKWLHRIDVPTLVDLGRHRPAVPEGTCKGLAGGDSRRQARDHSEMRTRAADRTARRVRCRARRVHRRAPAETQNGLRISA